MSTTPTTTAPNADVVAMVTPTGGGRLRPGELRRRVADYLAIHSSAGFTPGEVAHALSRSSGAVANALTTLAGRGEVAVVSGSRLRYQANAATRTAATAPAKPTRSTTRAGSGTGTRSGQARATTGKPAASKPTTTTTTATGAEPGSGPVVRPNGQTYHPRSLSGLPDVAALRKLRAAGVSALLYGPPGTGKTSVVEAAHPDLITVPGDGDTVVADFVGEYTQTPDGRYVFVHGPLITAMREGRCLFIDDATLIPPSVLAVVYPAMDGRRQVVIKAHGGETITAADGFYVIAGHNPGVHGAVLTDALASRFAAHIHVSTDYDLATELKIDRRAVRIAKNLATQQRRGEVGWAPQLRELLAYQQISDALGAEMAAGNLIGIAPEDDRDAVATAVRSVFGSTITPLALGARHT